MLIHNICKYINIDTARMLLYILVLRQLDYVNSILSRAPSTTVKPYQRTQNFAARVAHEKSKGEDVYTCLQELHWLPIMYRTTFKVLTIVCTTLQEKHPNILEKNYNKSTFLEPPDNQHHLASLWISDSTKKSFANRGFSYATPKYWNDLPEHIRKAKDIKEFKSLFKTHFFKLAFPSKKKKNQHQGSKLNNKTIL